MDGNLEQLTAAKGYTRATYRSQINQARFMCGPGSVFLYTVIIEICFSRFDLYFRAVSFDDVSGESDAMYPRKKEFISIYGQYMRHVCPRRWSQILDIHYFP